jgi:hypothetical protein
MVTCVSLGWHASGGLSTARRGTTSRHASDAPLLWAAHLPEL